MQVQIPAGVADGQTLRVPVNSSEAYVLLKVSCQGIMRGEQGRGYFIGFWLWKGGAGFEHCGQIRFLSRQGLLLLALTLALQIPLEVPQGLPWQLQFNIVTVVVAMYMY